MKPFMRSSKAGFTLVELIVVISILAILAGVAIPVYSGYIKKANEAADQQLLAAVNTAFGAACLENGRDRRSLSAAASLADGKLESVAPYNDSFMRYFAGNENNKFKVFASLVYNRADGVFKGYGEGEQISYAYSYTDSTGTVHSGTLSVDAAQLNSYLGSTWDEMGATALTGKIDYLATQAAAQFAAGGGAMLNTDAGFLSFIANDGYDWDGYIERLKTGSATEADQAAVTAAQAKWNALSETEKANALVFYTASMADEIDVDTIVSGLKNGTAPLETLTNPGAGGLVANGAVEYALLVAYCSNPSATISLPGTSVEAARASTKNITEAQANQLAQDKISELQSSNPDVTYNYELIKRKDNGDGTGTWQYIITATSEGEQYNAASWLQDQNISNLNSIVGSDGIFQTFMSSIEFADYVDTQAASDLNAYVAALNLVNSNTENVDIDSVLSQGWTDGGIADLIAAITGNP